MVNAPVTHGRLVYAPPERTGTRGMWGIAAKPYVMQTVKRVFGRARQERDGPVVVIDTPEVARDIEWLLQRYPLTMDGPTLQQLTLQSDAHRRREQEVAQILSGGWSREYMLREPVKPARDYQVQAASLAIATGRLLLTDEYGVGKTLSGQLTLMRPGGLPGLIVCQTHLQRQMQAKLAEFFPWLRSAIIPDTKPESRASSRVLASQPDVLIISYSKLAAWADHLAHFIKTVIFDEIQELRHDLTLKYEAACAIADGAEVKIGLSVGPESTVELVGGPFGDGWIGRIDAATDMIRPLARREQHGTHTFLRVEHLDVQSRGWTENAGFGWKPVKSFVEHPCTAGVRTLRTGGSGDLVITDEHSVYRVTEEGLDLARADHLALGDRLVGDDGRSWDQILEERDVDLLDVAAGLTNPQVIVDLAGVTRSDLGVSPQQWQNFHREAMHGPRLPLDLYRRHADKLPPATGVYLSAGRGGRVAPPTLRLSDWAYVLGFYLGDGWTEKSRVAFAVENGLVELVAEEIRRLPAVDLDPTIHRMPGRGSSVVRFMHPILAEMIRKVTSNGKAKTKTIPGEWITTWPEPARRELLRGLVDSDGHISKRDRRRYYTTTSKALAQSLSSLLRSLGINGSVSTRVAAPGGVVGGRRITSTATTYSVNWSASAENGHHMGHHGRRTRHAWTRDLLHEAPLLESSPIPEDQKPAIVYDLEMDEHPSFVVNGLLVHNTATPVYNYGIEAFNIIRVLDADALGTEDEFVREWCRPGDKHRMVKDPAMLGEYLRQQGLMLGRTRKEVGRELPDVIVGIENVDVDPAMLAKGLVDAAAMAQIVLNQQARHSDRFTAAGQVDMLVRKATGVAKAPYVAAFCKLLLEQEDKIVLFGWHRDVYDAWLEELAEYNPVLYTGSESPAQKEAARRAFCEGDSRIIIISLRSGTGLDGLQEHARVVVFGELDWSPQVHEQGIGRLRRDGQRDPVVAYYMVSDGGSDPLITEYLQIKRGQNEPMLSKDGRLFDRAPADRDRSKDLARAVLDQVGEPLPRDVAEMERQPA